MIYYLYGISATCYISFIWAAKFLFQVKDKSSRLGRNIISLLGLISIMAQSYSVYFYASNKISIYIASIIFTIAAITFWSAVKITFQKPFDFLLSKNEPQSLITKGPYKYIRHPFYTSYMLAWLAGIIASESIYSLISLSLIPIYILAAINEELNFERNNFSLQYLKYKKNTGMFLPNPYKIIKNG